MKIHPGARERLLGHCAGLSPFERILLQICSIVFEPTRPAFIAACLAESGYPPGGLGDEPGVRVAKGTARLQELKLLNAHCQCHEEIVEAMARSTLPGLEDCLLERSDVNGEPPWPCPIPSPEGVPCTVCSQVQDKNALSVSGKWLCPVCLEVELRKLADTEDFSSATPEDILDALSPDAGLYRLLTVLWRFEETRRIVSMGHEKAEEALVSRTMDHLAYDMHGLLASSVHMAAARALLTFGDSILPSLLQRMETASSSMQAGVMSVAAKLSPNDPRVRAMLGRAVESSSSAVRSRALDILGGMGEEWARVSMNGAKLEAEASCDWRESFPWRLLSLPRGTPSSPVVSLHDAPLGRFGRIARFVLDRSPLNASLYFQSRSNLCWRLVRDLRIAVLSGNVPMWEHKKEAIASSCTGVLPGVSTIHSVFENPFEEIWFARLPWKIQSGALKDILHRSTLHLDSDAPVLTYAAGENFLPGALQREDRPLLGLIVCRLLLAGRIADAESILRRGEEVLKDSGLRGWIRFIQGRHEESAAACEEDLRVLKKLGGTPAACFQHLVGVFHVLALITRRDWRLRKKIEGEIDRLMNGSGHNAVLTSVCQALRAIHHLAFYEQALAGRHLAASHEGSLHVGTFLHLLASYWLHGRLDEAQIDVLSRLFMQARQNRFDWVAFQCADLLCKAEAATPVRQNFIEAFEKESGTVSLVPLIEMEDPWLKSLKALRNTALAAGHLPSRTAKRRLIWVLDPREGRVSLQPLEQKTTARGAWTTGSKVPLGRLQEGQDLDHLSSRDHRIRSCIRKVDGPWGDNSYELDLSRALPALVGHPLVFLRDSPHVPVEIVRGEPDLHVTESSSGFHVTCMIPEMGNSVVLLRESPTRFRVIEFSEEHMRIVEILGPEGLHVPSRGRGDLLAVMEKVSKVVTVHSDLDSGSENIPEVDADTTPLIHLVPHGGGLKVEMFVRPFRDGGPLLKPGQGAVHLMTLVEGGRLQVRRDLQGERNQAEHARLGCPVLDDHETGPWEWLVEAPEDCLQMLLDLGSLRDDGRVALAWPQGESLRVTGKASFDSFRLKIRHKGDWFEMNGELAVDDRRVLSLKQLLDMVRGNESRFIPLGDGEFLALTREFKRRLQELDVFTDRRGREVRVHPTALMAVEELTKGLGAVHADREWLAGVERFACGEKMVPAVPPGLKAELRSYQREGFKWLARLAHMGWGACLADDMGLGKTLQALSILLHRAGHGPSLVIAPTSVCYNWMEEGSRFAPSLRLQIFGGNDRESTVKNLGPFDGLICSYGLLQQEADLLASVSWSTIVLDEAQAIKNMTTKRSRAAMRLKGEFKLVTTGTPIENHLGELWNLFHFINPGLLGSHQSFNQRFAGPIEKRGDAQARDRLKKLIQPFILRRAKSQVLRELPSRTEVVLSVEMNGEEAAFYEALRRQALERLERDNGDSSRKYMNILSEIMKLRQACCHPRLVLKDSPIPSSKLELLGEVVHELRATGHKLLIFSQFVGHLALIREYLDAMGLKYRYLDGSTPPRERKREVDAFQGGDGDLFLISLKAGGLGINLTAADYVIHMDPWWNPAVEDQASDRAHRIGQAQAVTIYRMVTRGTIEEKIVRLHENKKELAGALLEGTDATGKISTEELLRLIKER